MKLADSKIIVRIFNPLTCLALILLGGVTFLTGCLIGVAGFNAVAMACVYVACGFIILALLIPLAVVLYFLFTS
jgi:hypothetical protein